MTSTMVIRRLWLLTLCIGTLIALIGGFILAIPTSNTEAATDSFVGSSFSQEDGTPTPEARETMEPFTQADLQILSGNVIRPNGIFWHDDFLYVSCAGDFTLYRIEDTTGETITYFAGIQNSHDLYVEDNESGGVTVWVADYQRSAFLKGEDARVDALREELESPWGIDAADDGVFYMTQLRGADVIRLQRDGSYVVVASGFRNPTGIAVDGDFVYVANNGSARRAVEWFDRADDGAIDENSVEPLVQGLQNVTNLVMGPDDLLYMAYSLGTRGIVGRVDPEVCRENGGCTNADVEIVLWSEIAAPLAGLTLSDDMRLFVHTMFGSEIYWVQLPEAPETIDAATTVE